MSLTLRSIKYLFGYDWFTHSFTVESSIKRNSTKSDRLL